MFRYKWEEILSYPHSVDKVIFGYKMKLKCKENKNIGLGILEGKYNIGYRQVKKGVIKL